MCMYVWMYGCMDAYMDAGMHGCMHESMYVAINTVACTDAVTVTPTTANMNMLIMLRYVPLYYMLFVPLQSCSIRRCDICGQPQGLGRRTCSLWRFM